MLSVPQVAIVGTGLLGGSIGLGLRAAGFGGRIVGVGRTPATLDTARQRGCIDQATGDLGSALGRGCLVVLATPISAFAGQLESLAGCGRSDIVVTDVGSTKAQVCADARRLLPAELARRFVGTHPMAGAETHGPRFARPDLFHGRPCILTPDADTDPHALAQVEALWHTLGMRLVTMDAQRHDRMVARVSHLPHAVAALLVRLAVGGEGGLDIASTGFRDTTRVASGDPTVWVDVFMSNRGAVLEAIGAFEQELATLRALLTGANAADFRRLLEASKRDRDAWLHRCESADKSPLGDACA